MTLRHDKPLPNLTDAVATAQELLGWKLIHETAEGVAGGYIVETEAYTSDDPASHAYKGPTLRNASMFGPAGNVYVYFTYGMHFCMNIVTGKEGQGQGVLLRAIEPVEGVELMRKRRGLDDITKLTNGPAKLTQALGVGRVVNGTTIFDGPVRLEPGFMPAAIVRSPRIGISKAVDTPWRFHVADSPYVSKR